jgi:HEAT repeat protein
MTRILLFLAAVAVLPVSASQSRMDQLVELTSRSKPETVRLAAIDELGWNRCFGRQSVCERLLELTRADESVDVRLAAIHALGTPDAASYPGFRDAMLQLVSPSEQEAIRAAAIGSLGGMQSMTLPQIRDFMAELAFAGGEATSIRLAAIRQLGSCPLDPGMREKLRWLCADGDGDPAVQAAACGF